MVGGCFEFFFYYFIDKHGTENKQTRTLIFMSRYEYHCDTHGSQSASFFTPTHMQAVPQLFYV